MTTPTKTRHAAPCSVVGCPKFGKVHDRGNNADRAALQARMVALHGIHCLYCGNPGAERDRIVESCYYHAINLLPACKACNNARNANEGIALSPERKAILAGAIRRNIDTFGSARRGAPGVSAFRAALDAALSALES